MIPDSLTEAQFEMLKARISPDEVGVINGLYSFFGVPLPKGRRRVQTQVTLAVWLELSALWQIGLLQADGVGQPNHRTTLPKGDKGSRPIALDARIEIQARGGEELVMKQLAPYFILEDGYHNKLALPTSSTE